MPAGTTFRWTDGAGDGDWSTAGNWEDDLVDEGVFVASSTAPTTGKDIFIGRGDRDITAGLAQSAISPTSFTVGPGFQYSIGASGSSLELGTVTALNYAGTGSFMKLDATVTTAELDHPANRTVYMTGGAWSTVYSFVGNVECEAGAVLTSIYANGTRLNVATNATAITTMIVANSIVEVDGRDLATAELSMGSTLTTKGDTAITTRTLVGSGCRVNHQSTGDEAFLEAMPASVWTPVGAEYNFTVTASREWSGSKVTTEAPGIEVTFSSNTQVGRPSITA